MYQLEHNVDRLICKLMLIPTLPHRVITSIRNDYNHTIMANDIEHMKELERELVMITSLFGQNF